MYVYNILLAQLLDMTTATRRSPRRILVVDNDDSFTYNLAHLVSTSGGFPRVYSREHLARVLAEPNSPERAAVVDECDGVLLGPGHGRPETSAHTLRQLLERRPTVPVLGVCLGHQAIGVMLGAIVAPAEQPSHGARTLVSHDATHIFRGISSPFWVTRYNSLAISRAHLPAAVEITAELENGEIMGIRDKHRSIQGIQFHPESVLSEYGHQLFCNWLEAL